MFKTVNSQLVKFNYGIIDKNNVILFNRSEISHIGDKLRDIECYIDDRNRLVISAKKDQEFFTNEFIPLDKLDFVPDFHNIKTKTCLFSRKKIKGVKYFYRKPGAIPVNYIFSNYKIEIYE